LWLNLAPQAPAAGCRYEIRQSIFKKQGGVLMKFQVSAVAVLAVVVVSLGGCLVEKDKGATKTYASNTNILHTYEAGDVITYDLTEYSGTDTPRSGTLEVKWEQTADIKDPFSNTDFPVLKETTKIYYGNDASNAEVYVRYIEQDISGTIYLRAIDDFASTTDYWLSSNSNVPPGDLAGFEIFHSPFISGSLLQIDFNVMSGCTGTSCQPSLGTFSNGLEVVDNSVVVIGTRYGTFTNVYEVTYNGLVSQTDQTPLPFFDFLDICHITGLFNNTTHNGTLRIVPEVGVIQIINTCQAVTGQAVQYVAIIRNTNIPLPPLTN
jgi:hypothetical protein